MKTRQGRRQRVSPHVGGNTQRAYAAVRSLKPSCVKKLAGFWVEAGRLGCAVGEGPEGSNGVADDAEVADIHVECVAVTDAAAQQMLAFKRAEESFDGERAVAGGHHDGRCLVDPAAEQGHIGAPLQQTSSRRQATANASLAFLPAAILVRRDRIIAQPSSNGPQLSTTSDLPKILSQGNTLLPNMASIASSGAPSTPGS
ncbi:hypothetical protein [Mycobacterium lentiflavum]|uniref:Uncharacterized protein n=1 Tax=Mycobacterium lentiflavum TaxID=141349 RepID=A0ABY3UQ56_MYCLN|nr:hypothetical protein [Mycobacterium lentiflavum]ULP41585.2 hypothetical protein MJO58_22480 [Mycobacterium lentiflavum]